MYTYKLNKYCGATDDEEVVFEHEDENVVVEKAFEISKEDNDYERKYNVGIWTYRLERCKDGIHEGGWRFFNNGTELTNWIRRAALKGIEDYRNKQIKC